ncbi:MAG: AAA family ATPase [Bacteroidales bacterium]|nr:AAA family ATPase [Bacteroidales bacterium]MDD3914768.1 AAA family ATPase [Bacteroidales bacterium]MDD4634195.1 AAA family ATPase [Bacteroidales bacterium]
MEINDEDVKYPVGIQSFEKIRNSEFVYVDKTALVYRLANAGGCYFLSRPRRFGKSLLLSTLEAYFSGMKDLFKSLAIETLETKWTVYPVLYLDLNTGKYDQKEKLDEVLDNYLTYWESLYGTSSSEYSLEIRFKEIIKLAYEKTGQQVVVLVDEYDKPLLQAITNKDLQTEYRNTLKAFYSVLKTHDKYIKFAFITGVTKFSKISIFSDLNNLANISMDEKYQTICGITEAEIHKYFEESLNEVAEHNEMSYEETCAQLKLMYDGYHFVKNGIGIYNPFSLLLTLRTQEFGSYWFETGTPSFLVELLRKDDYSLPKLTEEEATGDVLYSIDSLSLSPIPIMYQSGYLTIKGYDKEFGLYKLGFPNKEVEFGFIKYLIPFYATREGASSFSISKFVNDVRSGNAEDFMKRMSALMSDTDYKIVGNSELYFQNVFYLIMKMMGFYTTVERPTSESRMDMIIKTKDYIYILEFKLDGSAEDALRQIEEKGYAKPFAMDSRKLFKIGVNFDTKKRCIGEWKMVENS